MSAQNVTLPIYCNLTHSQRISVSAGFTGIVIILCFVRVVLSYMFAVNSLRILHNITFQSILRVPVRFFGTNPIGCLFFLRSSKWHFTIEIHVAFAGRVLNRFSKDVSSLDNQLPFQITELLTVRLRNSLIYGVKAVKREYYKIFPGRSIKS